MTLAVAGERVQPRLGPPPGADVGAAPARLRCDTRRAYRMSHTEPRGALVYSFLIALPGRLARQRTWSNLGVGSNSVSLSVLGSVSRSVVSSNL